MIKKGGIDFMKNKLNEITAELSEIKCMIDDVQCELDEIQCRDISSIIEDTLSGFRVELANGVVLTPVPRLRLLSPDRTKQLLCYGGLKIEDTTNRNKLPDGWALSMQTSGDTWEFIHIYPEKESATEALVKVKNAMNKGCDNLEL